MSRKNFWLAGAAVCLLVVSLFSFKSVNEGNKVTIFRQYLSTNADFGNFILINFADGKIKKQLLLQNKHVNYEANDKLFTQQLNELLNSGMEIKHITSSGDASLTITTIILK